MDAKGVEKVLFNTQTFILPSYGEGVPRVCLEALAAGCTVVFPPDILEFKGCKGIHVNELSPTSLAKSLMDAKNQNLPEKLTDYDLQKHDYRFVAKEHTNLSLKVKQWFEANALCRYLDA